MLNDTFDRLVLVAKVFLRVVGEAPLRDVRVPPFHILVWSANRQEVVDPGTVFGVFADFALGLVDPLDYLGR